MALGTLVAKQSHDRWNEVRHALIAAAPEGQPHASLLLSIEELVARLDSREQFWDTLQMHESERLELASEIGQLQLLVKDAQENYERLLRHTNNGHESKLDSQTGAAGYRTMNYEPLSPAVQLAADEHTKVLAQLQSAKSRDAGLAARMAYLQERLGQLTMDPELELLAKDVRCISSILGLFFYLPSYMVTLMLTLAMGALGSVIFITHQLFHRKPEHKPERRVSWYFMRPFLGMTLAFAMYILVQAGQFALADPSGPVGDINPFSIAFLGIISGLLSEPVYDLIVRTGERMFKSDSAPNPEATPGAASAGASS